LGRETLEEYDAFNAYQEHFVDTEEYDEACDIHYIRWVNNSEQGSYLDSDFDDFEFTSGPTPQLLVDNANNHNQQQQQQQPQTPLKPARGRWSILSRARKNNHNRNVLTVGDSRRRFDKYLEFRDNKERRMRIKAQEVIEQLAVDQQLSAAALEDERVTKYDGDRARFVARHAAAVAASS
jgi:hypothetical protein